MLSRAVDRHRWPSSSALVVAVGRLRRRSSSRGPWTRRPLARYSPYVDREYATEVYWGDTHVHTSWSPDANAGGNTRIDPDAAYRFAKGETVMGHNGQPVRLRRPLDFLVVADHSEYMGLFPMLEAKDPDLLANETGARWAGLIAEGKRAQVGSEFAMGLPAGKDLIKSPAFQRSVWNRVIENAERHDEPGRFTAFVGYEWSSMPRGANLHRIVLFADGADKVSQVVPFRSIDSVDPEALWRYLADYERTTGGRALAIPHNSNLSAGRMFELVDMGGKPFSKAYATERARWEPLVEATQIKGDSETAPFLSPDDEFADYGTWDSEAGMTPAPHEDWMYEGEYVRSGLARGLAVEETLGVNPFAFGLIGSTDSHTGLATADDEDFWGKFNSNEPAPTRAAEPWAKNFLPQEGTEAYRQFQAAGFVDRERPTQSMTWRLVASGFAAVWAKENTRAALFDAMRRRETYATTGPRMVVRFFGGWDFGAQDASAPDLAAVGYAKGVPMGGVLPSPGERPPSAAPSFLVSALRDPEGANLDRVQIIKQWIDAKGDAARADLRRGALGEEAGRCERPLAGGGGQYGRSREGELRQYDRGEPAHDGLARSRLRSEARRRLLRACARDSHPALDDLRCGSLRDEAPGRLSRDDAGAGVHVAHLVRREMNARRARARGGSA